MLGTYLSKIEGIVWETENSLVRPDQLPDSAVCCSDRRSGGPRLRFALGRNRMGPVSESFHREEVQESPLLKERGGGGSMPG